MMLRTMRVWPFLTKESKYRNKIKTLAALPGARKAVIYDRHVKQFNHYVICSFFSKMEAPMGQYFIKPTLYNKCTKLPDVLNQDKNYFGHLEH